LYKYTQCYYAKFCEQPKLLTAVTELASLYQYSKATPKNKREITAWRICKHSCFSRFLVIRSKKVHVLFDFVLGFTCTNNWHNYWFATYWNGINTNLIVKYRIVHGLKLCWIDLKLHRMIDLIIKKCSAQELVLCTSLFLSYCPLLIFILYFCPGHFS
jgi:hypothetical protein